ncbi:crotonobetainyl-CoA:carnitine CoA-transferase CaiB-like acyl-CoA transferase [Caldalkalibacillus uzonensis]|uniref:Crotonobetainyl-CoA:carnitine CoA-transferase CaiB-like acyl-CoA transferase n=1 Tax=Caldalkalibacillus uzonensis TaxID=353224 RepID=A0ABU0CQM1_9BACI|nr:CoA transferase [Caldalkalibacillus uzonensis]MDQ0338194.1 crotonobetainyl-CoA:carnitine CoA-transferase CaiB-like acyl-CoA transferase [Caldalkalibacillus uzonensis]
MKALHKMKIVDVTQVMAGPYCTMVLGDLGAEVIKVEKYPKGDDTRDMGPYVNGESYCYMMINRNKKGIRLNLKKEQGKEILLKLVETADVFVENFRPGVTKKLGIDYDTLRKINPGLIYCSISGYGQTGPYSHKGGFDIMAQGMSGIMSMTGEKDGGPCKVGIAIHDIAASMTAVYNILAAYIHKLETGQGQYIDVSLVESGLAWTIWEAAAYFGAGEVPQRTGTRHRVSAPYQGIKTKDGYVLVGAANQRTWENFCKLVVNKPEWIEDPRFVTNQDRQKHVDELEKLIEEIFVNETTEYWVTKMEQAGVPGGPILTYDQTLNNEHILSRNMVEEVEHPVAGTIKMLGIPAKLSGTPGTIHRPAPTLGQHTEEVLKELNFSGEEIARLKKDEVI